jgi:hypothetical protein
LFVSKAEDPEKLTEIKRRGSDEETNPYEAHLSGDDLVELVVHLVHRSVRVHRHPGLVTQSLVITPHLHHRNG